MFKHRTYIPFIVLGAFLFLLSSCTTTVKQTWRDFTAYYNTYYNAKRSFKTGLEQVRDQSVNINPEQPIRIHTAPVSAGQQDFKKAITKGAKILRKFPESRWVDDALHLIGKSYYYRQEYFSAEQKFRELYANANSRKMKQEAVLWRGRILMEMELYSQGISYLQNELSDLDKWDPEIKAEIQAVLAELYSYMQQWESANEYLVDAIPELKDKTHKARAYFLHGQVLERMDRLEEAFGAYSNVPGLHPPYDIIYHARRKQAEVSREAGNLQRAHRIFVEMSKDDKNFEILPELKYEIARTLQAMGDTEEAERMYKNVLHNSNQQTTAVTRAKTYYGLATLYREQRRDFRTAAAYYDSASSAGAEQQKLPVDFKAGQLSESFGEYADLKTKIQTADSLMWLGSLPKAKFDSVLARIRERRREKLERMRKNQRQQANTRVAGNQGYTNDTGQPGQNNQSSGFLNYKNKQLVMEGRQQFEAYWGNRPLVDHWRRLEMIRQLKESADTSLTQQGEEQRISAGSQELRELNIDLKEIPFSEEARQMKKQEIFKAQYELANTFFLSLNMPDSARFYYHKIIEQAPDTAGIIPQALYSLSELHYIENDSSRARQLARQLVEKYPETEFARRVASRFNFTLPENSQQQSRTRRDSAYIKYRALIDSITKLHSLARARAYRNFARHYEGRRAAAYALFKSARQYLNVARITASPEKRYKRERIEKLLAVRPFENNVLATLTRKGGALPDIDFPCSGVYWDSVRTVADQLHRNYTAISVSSRIDSVNQDSLFSCRDIRLVADMSPDIASYVQRLKRAEADHAELDEAGRAFVDLRDRLTETLTVWKAEKNRKYALSHPTSKVAPSALHSAARSYMELGRRDSIYRSRADRWFKEQDRYKLAQAKLQQKRDSVQAVLQQHSDQLKSKPKRKKVPDEDRERDQEPPERPEEPGQPGSPDEPRPRDRSGRNNVPERPEETSDRAQPAQRNSANQNKTNQATSSDTTQQISEEKLKQLQQQFKNLKDSTATPPDYNEVFPYVGPYWDSTRVILDQFTSTFNEHKLREEVEQLKAELALPEVFKKQAEDSVQADTSKAQPVDTLEKAPPDTAVEAPAGRPAAKAADTVSKGPLADSMRTAARPDSVPGGRPNPQQRPPVKAQEDEESETGQKPGIRDTDPAEKKKGQKADSLQNRPKAKQQKVYTCKELEVKPNVKGGMEVFTDKIEFPEKYKNLKMDGEAVFNIVFDKYGDAVEAESATISTKEGFNEAIAKAIRQHMSIEPVTHQNKPVRMRCKMTIPIILNSDQ